MKPAAPVTSTRFAIKALLRPAGSLKSPIVFCQPDLKSFSIPDNRAHRNHRISQRKSISLRHSAPTS